MVYPTNAQQKKNKSGVVPAERVQGGRAHGKKEVGEGKNRKKFDTAASPQHTGFFNVLCQQDQQDKQQQ